MNQKIIIHCPHCKVNHMAEVISYDYVMGDHYDRLLSCLGCNRPINEHTDLRREKTAIPSEEKKEPPALSLF